MEPSPQISIEQAGMIKEPWYKPLFEVTTLSKLTAAVVFITLPFLGFYFGIKFQTETADEFFMSEKALDERESIEYQSAFGAYERESMTIESESKALEIPANEKYSANDFTWVIENRADNSMMLPRQQLSLEVAGKQYVVGGYTGCTTALSQNHQLLPNEITRQRCLHPEGSYDVSVFFENDQYMVKERALLVAEDLLDITITGEFTTKFLIE